MLRKDRPVIAIRSGFKASLSTLFICSLLSVYWGSLTYEFDSGPVVSVSSINSCIGEIRINSVTSGVPPYSYRWRDSTTGNYLSDTTRFISGLSPGFYIVEITDSLNNTGSTVFEITDPPELTGTIRVFDALCKGEESGRVEISMDNGNPNYFYTVNSTTTSFQRSGVTSDLVINITNLPADDYEAFIRDSDGCEGHLTFTIGEPDTEVGADLKSLIDPLCFGDSTGRITVEGTGGTITTVGYRYEWYDEPFFPIRPAISDSSTLINVPAGLYRLRVFDENGCQYTEDFTLTDPPQIVVSDTAIVNASCFGFTDGSIDITATGGTGTLMYSWSNGETTQDLSGIGAGTYTLTITDANGCTLEETYTVTQPSEIIITESVTNVSCRGENTGIIDISLSGGAGGYIFSWSDSSTDLNRSGLAAGDYTLTVTDQTGCSVSETYTISEPADGLSLDGFTDVSPTCAGGSDGSLAVTVSGGTGGYTYRWSTNATSSNISGLTAGTYSVTVRDGNGCSVNGSFTLVDPVAITANPSFTPPSCNGENDGSITLAASNGTGPYTYNWGTGDSGPTINNLSAGSYTVTITDAIGCQVVETIELTEPDALADNAVISNVSCNGFDDGSIELNITGGTPNYSIMWSTGETSNSISGLEPGPYTVTITDNNGCFIVENYTITEPDELTLSSTQVDVLCFGEATGSIDVTVTGGTIPYTYSWSSGQVTQNLSNIVADTYTLTVTDANGCQAIETVTIMQPASGITVNENITNLSCSGDPTGIIALDVSGGSPPYTYLWNDGEITEDRTGLAEGNYTVTITDDNGCQVVRNIPITQPAGITIDRVVQNITCNSEDDGAIDITVSGGSSPYTYDWGGGITSEDRQNLAPGSYSIIVTDNNGCQSNATFTISEPDELEATSTKTDILCFGEATGSIDLTVVGGTMPYTYDWSNGATAEDLIGVTAGTYTVTVRDANGCTTDHEVTLTQPGAALSVDGVVTNESCSGFSNAGVVLTVTGGTEPYDYSWSNGSTDKDISAVNPGSYQVTVTDANGCSVTRDYTITGPQPLDLTALTTDLVCFEQSDGAINLTVAGGTGPFTFSWSNGATTEDLDNLLAGTYEVTVTDVNGCNTTASYTLTQPTELRVDAAVTGVSCFGEVDGAINLGVAGGVAPYTYSWSNGATSQDLSALVGGDYTITVTDANGCQVVQTHTVPAPTAPLAATGAVVEVACNGEQTGGVILTPTGGTAPYTYTWSNGTFFKDLTNVFPGSYSVDIVDANGCTFSTSFEIGESTPITATFIPTEPTCFGDANGSILLEVSGGVAPYTYFWSNGSTSEDQFNLVGGPYAVTIRDANNCTLTRTIDLGGNRGLDIDVNKTDVTCKGEATGAISLNVFGGTGNFTYAWNTGATTRSISGLTAGVYECVVTDEDGCDNTVSVIIAEPSQVLSAQVDFTDLLTCFGGNDGVAMATPSGGTAPYTYLWSTGERTSSVSGLVAGSYNVIIEDFNGCVFQRTFEVAEPAAPITASFSGKLALDCAGDQDGALEAVVSGGQAPYRYLWSNGSAQTSISNLAAGTYFLRITDSRGCTEVIEATITEPDVLEITEFTINDTQCFGDRTGSIEITVSGGTAPYAYLWSDGSTSRNLSGIGTGTYDVRITDANGCEFNQQFVLDNAPLFILQPDVTPISCHNLTDASISLNITGGTPPYNISWNNGEDEEIISELGPGTYTATVVDDNGCTLEQSFEITNPMMLTADRIIENANGCDDPQSGSITVIASGGRAPYTYDWSNGMTTPVISNIPPGIYTVTVTDSFGCTYQASYPVTQPDPIAIELSTELGIDCETQEVNALVSALVEGGFGNYRYTWSKGGSTGSSVEISDPGRLVVLITDERGCQRQAEVDINIPQFAAAEFSFSSESIIRDGSPSANDPISFTDISGSGAVAWRWHFGDDFTSTEQNPVHIYRAPGSYTVTLEVTDEAGCTTVRERLINILDGYRLMIPNAFTPNGDGLNDLFRPRFFGFQQVEFWVFSKWGDPVFNTNEVTGAFWDGTLRGEPAQSGSYAYKFSGVTFTGLKIERTGAFRLIKK